MSDTAQYAFQANFKFGPQFKETLVNVPANSPDEMLGKLEWLTANAAKFVAAHAALHAVSEVAPLAGNTSNVAVTNDAPAQPNPQQNSGWGAPPQQAPPSFAQPNNQAPACAHGPMVFREGTSAKGPWKAYFCPTPKGTPNQCQAQFQK